MTDTGPGRRDPWYAEGLAFRCHGCSDCCRGDGYVWIDATEARELAAFLSLDVEEFGRRFLRRVGERTSLVDKPNKECIFLDGGCTVYDARPTQCRTFPFWPENLRTETDWELVSRRCRGAGSGDLYPLDRIRRLSAKRGATDSGPGHLGGCGCA